MLPGTHVLIAANPKSGASSRTALVSQLHNQLTQCGFQVTVCDRLEQVRQQSHQLTEAGQLHCVVAAGGDGTAAAVVNLIPPNTALAIFPLGTENLLARHLSLTNDPQATAQAIRAKRTISLDAGLAAGRLFLVMLGCGFDAEVVSHMHQLRSGHINRWSYAKPIWRAIRNYKYPVIEVECLESDDGQPAREDSRRFSTAWLFAFNLPRYAANLKFCPQANGNDGCLDLCAFQRGGLLTGLGYLWRLWRGTHQQLPDFRHMRGRRFRLSSQGRVPYQVDGDPGGELPIEVEVLPSRLTLIVPQGQ